MFQVVPGIVVGIQVCFDFQVYLQIFVVFNQGLFDYLFQFSSIELQIFSLNCKN